MEETKSSTDSSNSMKASRRASVAGLKGVVPQHNQKWGAQIYVRHRRVWLGTFGSQEAAALAYDRACLNFKPPDAPKNFLTAEKCEIESVFQERYNKEHVVQMIREHTYEEHFNGFMAGNFGIGFNGTSKRKGKRKLGINNIYEEEEAAAAEHLFDKEVTPSDVGKLNRLVIPKQHAERNFPPAPHSKLDMIDKNNGERETVLVFVDADERHKIWEFRYSFWKSSQSYVLTRGWSKYVKDKTLQAGDIVSFHRCNTTANLYISVTLRSKRRKTSTTPGRPVVLFVNNDAASMNFYSAAIVPLPLPLPLPLHLGGIVSKELNLFPAHNVTVPKSVKLFGVEIGAG